MFEGAETKKELITDIEYFFNDLYEALRDNQIGLKPDMFEVKKHIDSILLEIKKEQ